MLHPDHLTLTARQVIDWIEYEAEHGPLGQLHDNLLTGNLIYSNSDGQTPFEMCIPFRPLPDDDELETKLDSFFSRFGNGKA